MRPLLCVLSTLSVLVFADIPSKNCPFPEGQFTHADTETVADMLRFSSGGGMGYDDKYREIALRVFFTLPQKQKKEIAKKVFDSNLSDITTRAKQFPLVFDKKESQPAIFELYARDSDTRGWFKEWMKSSPPDIAVQPYYGDALKWAEANIEQPLSEADLKKPQGKTAKNISEWLGLLPEKFRDEFAMAIGDDAGQGSSVENPRILWYDRETVVAFNGNASQKRYHVAEVLKMDLATGKNRLFIVSEGKQGTELVAATAKDCSRCHGPIEDPQGRFGNYNFWRGMVGEYDDILLPNSDAAKAVANLKKMHSENHPRYKHLIGLEEYEKVEQYHKMNPYSYRMDKRPNDRLNRILNLQSMVRFVRKLTTETPNYCEYRYAILAALIQCDDISSFLPDTLRSGFPKFENVLADTIRIEQNLLDLQKKNNPTTYFGIDQFFDAKAIAGLRYLLEGRGISMRFWSTDPIAKYGWGDGEYHVGDFARLLALSDKDLATFSSKDKIKHKEGCEELKALSLAALKNMAPPTSNVFVPTLGHEAPPPKK